MFQTVQIEEIFDQVPEDHPAYWLAQMRKADWQRLLEFVQVTMPASTKKRDLVRVALEHYEFVCCEGRGGVWQVWTTMRHNQQRGLVIQFRHSEKDWSRGTPEFVDLEKNEPLGKVNIVARLMCKVK